MYTRKDGILITGATGFLGAHIVGELALNYKLKLICLVRGASFEEAEKKLSSSMNFYFGNKSKKILEKIEIICGDFTQNKFGLKIKEYEKLGNSISHTIHAGAIVKFFGKNEDFEITNVYGTSTIIEFCKQYNIFLLFTSSIAVHNSNGRSEADWSYQPEDEVGVYALSKIKAEKMILAQVNQGRMRAAIVRIGSLSGRYSDGVFQINMSESATYTILKTIITSRKMPKNFMKSSIELLPVDLCSQGIAMLLEDNKNGIFCFYNHNTITYEELILLLKDININIEVKEYHNFQEYLNDINDCNLDDRDLFTSFYFQYKRNRNKQVISINCNTEITNQYLAEKNLKWPQIDQNYLRKIVNDMKKVKYIEFNNKPLGRKISNDY